MLITEVLARNAKMYGQEKCLTEINMDSRKASCYMVRVRAIENSPQGNTVGI